MKTSTLKAISKDLLILASLMGVAILVSTLIQEPSFATSLISPDDNLEAVSLATGGESDGKRLIQTMLNYVLGFLGFGATLIFIYAGILYVSSAGNDDEIGKAKTMMKNSIIGIAIIFLSFAVVNTVLTGLGGGASSTPGV